MKRLLYSLSGLGLVSLLVLGTLALGAKAEAQCPDPHSPVRGTWSFSQLDMLPLITGGPVTTEVGVLTIDECGIIHGSGTINTPVPPNPLTFTFTGTITTAADGTAVARLTAFGQTFGEACVLMNNCSSRFL